MLLACFTRSKLYLKSKSLKTNFSLHKDVLGIFVVSNDSRHLKKFEVICHSTHSDD